MVRAYESSRLSSSSSRVCVCSVYYYSDAWMTGTYMNNPHVLVRFDVPPGEHVFTLVVSQYMRWRDVYYTLQALCMAPVSAPPRCRCRWHPACSHCAVLASPVQIKLAPVPERFPRKLQTASMSVAARSLPLSAYLGGGGVVCARPLPPPLPIHPPTVPMILSSHTRSRWLTPRTLATAQVRGQPRPAEATRPR